MTIISLLFGFFLYLQTETSLDNLKSKSFPEAGVEMNKKNPQEFNCFIYKISIVIKKVNVVIMMKILITKITKMNMCNQKHKNKWGGGYFNFHTSSFHFARARWNSRNQYLIDMVICWSYTEIKIGPYLLNSFRNPHCNKTKTKKKWRIVVFCS